MAGSDPSIEALMLLMTRADVQSSAMGRLRPGMMVSMETAASLVDKGVLDPEGVDHSVTATQGLEQEEEQYPKNTVLSTSVSQIVFDVFKQCSYIIVEGHVLFTNSGIEIQHKHDTPGAYVIGSIHRTDFDRYWVKDGPAITIFVHYPTFLEKIKSSKGGEMRYDSNGKFWFIKDKINSELTLATTQKPGPDMSDVPKDEDIIISLTLPATDIIAFFPRVQHKGGWRKLETEITNDSLIIRAEIKTGITFKTFYASMRDKTTDKYQFTRFMAGNNRRLQFDLNGIQEVYKLINGKKTIEMSFYSSDFVRMRSTYGSKSSLDVYIPLLPIGDDVAPMMTTGTEEIEEGESTLEEFA